MNASGQVIGYSYAANGMDSRAFSWTAAGGMIDLGTLGGTSSYAFAVNASGHVVGSSHTAAGAMHAFLWTPGGGMQDLGTLPGGYSGASALNDRGQAVGFSSYKHSLGARAPVVVEVSADNGGTWRTVAETATTGSTTSSFGWAVDLLPTSAARVRIRARDGSGARAMSRAFTVTAVATGG